jgi:murein DD-endopeptidase MepM/ murein hydrolase activator NlpD
LNAAESALAQTREEMATTRQAIAALEGRIDRTRGRLEKRAVIAFENGPASTIDLLLSSGSFTDFSDKLEFLGSMAQSDSDLVAELEVGTERLDRTKQDLAALTERQSARAAELRSARESAQRTADRVSATYDELLQKYRQELAAQQATNAATQVLGQTPQPGSAIQVCPVAGPNSFVDSFGWPRVGHTHQGIDLISPFGTPVVAAHPGVVTHSSSSTGGIQAYVRASSGTYTFYAHLSSYSSASGSVGAGTVIGYVGSTGNAGSVNHLHFEYHPGGGAAVDPYQMLLAVC